MRTTRVFIDASLASGQVIELERSRAHYLKNVLRLKPGAAFFLFDGREPIDYAATLLADGKDFSAEIGEAHPLNTESSLDSEIIAGLGRADHTDWMIQKTTELGVNRISLFNAERTQTPLKTAQHDKKLAHWRGIAISACEQSGRALIPEIVFHSGLEAALAASDSELRLLLDFETEALVSALGGEPASAALLLGPEGGLNAAEIEIAAGSGFQPASLGPRVLRMETAATAALAILQSAVGDFR